jgi:Alkylmercury lyase
MTEALDGRVRAAIYQHIVETTAAPTVAQIGQRLGLDAATIRSSYQRLFARRVLALGSDGESIVMAPPFSGVVTQHRVTVGDREYFANCAWDALGIPAALHSAATIHSRCEQTLQPLTIRVANDGPDPVGCVAHFAVPAARWWDDIGFT